MFTDEKVLECFANSSTVKKGEDKYMDMAYQKPKPITIKAAVQGSYS